MTITLSSPRPPRKILGVVTVARGSCQVPILELCRILHERGHEIEFACLKGQKKGIEDKYPFVSKVHTVGRDITHAEDEMIYRIWDDADLSTAKGRADVITGFKFFSSFWSETYSRLNELICKSRPDFILADVLSEAPVDMMNLWNIPIAVYYGQLPVHMAPAKYIPGLPGMQQRCLTSEHASLWDRVYEDIWTVQFIFAAKELMHFRKEMRQLAEAPPATMIRKPKHLVLVNSFFGLEAPRALPPLIQQVGPLLPEEWTPLGDFAHFLDCHKKTVYIAFGSHVNLPDWRIAKVIHGITAAFDSGAIDSVIWAMKVQRTIIDPSEAMQQDSSIDRNRKIDYTAILSNQHPHWKILGWAPQRAILEHTSVCLFVSHCASLSAMEGLVHGVPFLGMPFYVGDQMGNARRLEDAGVCLTLDKHRFTAAELGRKVEVIVRDENGNFGRNVVRMQRIAHAGLKRKYAFCDMLEEVMYDHEMRFEHNQNEKDKGGFTEFGRELRPMHLQTADARMPWWKATNLDIYILYASLVGLLATLFLLGIVSLWYGCRALSPLDASVGEFMATARTLYSGWSARAAFFES